MNIINSTKLLFVKTGKVFFDFHNLILLWSWRSYCKDVLKVANGANFDIILLFVAWKYYFQMKLTCGWP